MLDDYYSVTPLICCCHADVTLMMLLYVDDIGGARLFIHIAPVYAAAVLYAYLLLRER